MEKVKITAEQLKALDYWKENELSFDLFIVTPMRGKWNDTLNALNDVSPEDFSLMLHGWYEVEEPPFKVGDWVCKKGTHEYYRVALSRYDGNSLAIGHVTRNGFNFEKIEEPWKIMLLDLGREKPEFLRGDSYSYKRVDGSEDFVVIVKPDHEMHVRLFSQGQVIEFFPKQENGIKLQGGN